VEDVPRLPDLILFLAKDMSVVHIVRCGLTCGTLSGECMLTFILLIITGDLFKIVSNWTVLAAHRVVRRVFPNSEEKPLNQKYMLPLPRYS
jgi:hypothetical protein